MRAAKHRFESLGSPLSRLCLDWEACIGLLVRLMQERPAEPAGAYASATLEALDEEMMLQCALLADACDECIVLIRFFDAAEVDNAKIAQEVQRFCKRITQLFEEQLVWTTEGYTKQTLKFLEDTHHFLVRGSVLRSVGGPRAVTRRIKTAVLERMLAWTALAREVVAAEHPNFELVSSFSCFDLRELANLLQTVGNGSFPAALSEPLERLASTFRVDPVMLCEQFCDHGAVAAARFKDTGCGNLEAWQHALRVTSSTAARSRHPACQLEVVLAEYAAMTSSDSIIERDFSRVKRILSDQQLHAGPGVESDTVLLAVADPEQDREVIQQARVLWSELYASSRKRQRPRFDRGVARPLKKLCLAEGVQEKPTETEFRKRRRADKDAEQAPQDSIVPADPANAWTAKHDKEVAFNKDKGLTRLFDALRSNTVPVSELPEGLLELAVAHFEKIERNMQARERAESARSRAVSRICPSEASLEGLSVWVPDELRSVLLDNAIERRGWDVTQQLHTAKVLILRDLASLCDLHAVAAALNGAWVVTPHMTIMNQGTCLKLKPGIRTKRSIFMTDDFQAAHAPLAALLTAMQCRTLQLINSIDDFAAAKQLATNRGCPASVIALIDGSERDVFRGIAHCYETKQFREFVWRLDVASSCPGL